ncbi:glycosyltransferase involved in cell wall biosynthesis [Pseudorhizobium tarimense]|uniref:Glycosyltransferase involved in cell wall biosynthesis n=1 Tax=Pseudorhizobium tarimense TaxID=1079109 RepID=A0ABV2H913_9HYPH|nr:glycosyltransferase family 4 protein [Pseudorhizobium tarimense]MCJ8520082.1 glycosyltransferase family 4 protein [Pseudorhizobium tarimense]
MSSTLYFAYPGDLQTRTGGYGYDRRIIGALRDAGREVHLLPLGDGFPDAPDLTAAEAVLAEVPEGSLLLIDGLAFGVLDQWAEQRAAKFRLFALVHHPLALETGLSRAAQADHAAREQRALSFTRGVIVTSEATAKELVENYGVAVGDVVVALPGTDPVPLAVGRGAEPLILSVGSLTQRKGHDVLIAALSSLKDLPWTCRIVGSRELDPAVAAKLKEQIVAADLWERVTLAGEVEDVRPEFARADLFALASRYEGYGMVFAEALVHGLPVVGCATGAVPDVVPEAAGILVEPDDPEAFAAALARLLTKPDDRTAMADAAAVAGAALPSWEDTAAVIAELLEKHQ